MEVSPARSVLGLKSKNTDDSSEELASVLNEANCDTSTNIIMGEQPIASANGDTKLSNAISICTPLLLSAIDGDYLDATDIGEILDEMLVALKDILDSVFQSLGSQDICSAEVDIFNEPELVTLCVSMVSKLWNVSGETPSGIASVISECLSKCHPPTIKERISNVSTITDVICVLIKNGQSNAMGTSIPIAIGAIDETTSHALKYLLKAGNNNSDALAESLQNASAKILKEIINYDYVSYIQGIRVRAVRNNANNVNEFNLTESVRRHKIVWDAYVQALSNSMRDIKI